LSQKLYADKQQTVANYKAPLAESIASLNQEEAPQGVNTEDNSNFYNLMGLHSWNNSCENPRER
jgi:hypothetical protein